MRKELVESLQCSECGGSLRLSITKKDKIEIREGTLICKECGHVWPIINGMAYLSEAKDKLLLAELDGWVEYSKKSGWYDVDDNYLCSLPYPDDNIESFNWERHACDFEFLVDRLPTVDGLTVLDLGAGRCWSSRILAECGANVIAVDALDDAKVGLGAGDVMIRHEPSNIKYFDRVVADVVKLPFKDESMDIIIFSGALHHVTDLYAVLGECNRVLKKGGYLGLTNEPCTGMFGRESIGKPNEFGINEHNYKYSRYMDYLKHYNFKTVDYPEPYAWHDKVDDGIVQWYDHLVKQFKGGVLVSVSQKL